MIPAVARVVFALVLAAPTASGPIDAVAEDDSYVTHGRRQVAASVPVSTAARSGVIHEHVRRPLIYCGNDTQDRTYSAAPCVDGAEDAPVIRLCEDGSQALAPLYRRTLDASTGEVVEGWRQLDNGGCPEDPAVDVVLSIEEFRRLPLTPAAPVIQPSDGRALINLGVAVHTDGSAQELTTTVVGVPVRVRATPVQFSWDFGDGSPPIVTSSAGAGWPDHAALGAYPEPGSYELRLTTTWRGEFQVDGAGPWLPVTGTATTTSDPVAITVETAPTRLYADR